MTRQCAWCQASLGPEKCPQCGAEGLPLALTSVIVCKGAGEHVFQPGEGGTSHGMCEPCQQNAHAGAAGGVL